jgi:C4-type Zn-finger protein
MVTIEEARLQIEELRAEVDKLTLSYHEVRQVEIILMRTLTLIERATGSKEIQQAINKVQTLIMTIRMAQIAMHALEVASGPIGWAYAATTVISAAAMATSLYEVNTH